MSGTRFPVGPGFRLTPLQIFVVFPPHEISPPCPRRRYSVPAIRRLLNTGNHTNFPLHNHVKHKLLLER